ncbi:hypothetical protein ES332_D11G388400v1 [Gossypium tomentosum]|uniref:Uncharacterized protein n=1 Tax=Gossypium tomentosum TaxID=34277 RepID=A0A5D2IYV2_GOSTO|nr:hypothetical protein ES332_D11G388400v1 [Gossypium tomentosum]
MAARIEQLEAKLREVAALEISLYSVILEQVSSANKVHTHAWCLSRLYIHACKHWSGDKQAMITKNTVSGLILITKSCCNDASSRPQATKSFLIDLRKMAFEDAFQLTFSVRAGAMNVVACQLLQVMEQCVARLDVAMFYAILWESKNEIPTDPISNPIVDSKVLLSFSRRS